MICCVPWLRQKSYLWARRGSRGSLGFFWVLLGIKWISKTPVGGSLGGAVFKSGRSWLDGFSQWCLGVWHSCNMGHTKLTDAQNTVNANCEQKGPYSCANGTKAIAKLHQTHKHSTAPKTRHTLQKACILVLRSAIANLKFECFGPGHSSVKHKNTI